MLQMPNWRAITRLGLLLAAATLLPFALADDLIDAAKSGDTARAESLIKNGADLTAAEPDGSTALHWAVVNNDLELAGMLLDAGADAGARTRYTMTPIHLAAENGNPAMIKRLLDAGADANTLYAEGQTPLMTAALSGNPEAIRVLLTNGADVNAREMFKGQTALMFAAREGNAEAAEMLIEFGADVKAQSAEGFTPLLFAVRNDHAATAKVLLDHGANVEDQAADGTTALNIAVVNAYYGMASLLLDYNADPNAADARGSALHTIAWLRKPGATGTAGVGGTAHGPPLPTGEITSLELVQKLIDHGANLNPRIHWPESRFGKAGGTTRNPPNIDLGRHLLTYNGATPFYVAAKNGDIALMRLLADNGADGTIGNDFGVTPLMVAAGMDYWEGEAPGPFTGVPENERLEAVKLAVEVGNDINARTDFGDYPMEGTTDYTLLYYPYNLDDLVNLGVGDPRWDGCTALHGAVISNQPSIVAYLVEQGAKVNVKNELGWTPLLMSRGVFLANAKKEFPEIEKILMQALKDGDSETAE